MSAETLATSLAIALTAKVAPFLRGESAGRLQGRMPVLLIESSSSSCWKWGAAMGVTNVGDRRRRRNLDKGFFIVGRGLQ